mgnify:CR=1 FL=1
MREKPGKRPQKPTISLRKPAISASGFLAERIIQRFPNEADLDRAADAIGAQLDLLEQALHAIEY